MKKITEIYIEKEYQKSERDFLGNRIKVPAVGKFKRDVVLAGHWERLGHYIIDFAIIFVATIIIGIALIVVSPKVFNFVMNFGFSLNLGFTNIKYDLISYLISGFQPLQVVQRSLRYLYLRIHQLY